MHLFKHCCLLLLLCLSLNAAADTPPVLHHVLQVTPDLATGSLQVEDTVSVPPNLRTNGEFAFVLGDAFQLDTPSVTTSADHHYRIALAPEQTTLTLRYRGKLTSTPDCAWLTQACVLLNQRGVYLDAGAQWYPQAANALHTFELHVTLPEGWVSLSQGKALADGWQEMQPQDSIYLLAGKFHVYQQQGKHANAMVYLQSDDAALAQRYLQATEQYLTEYSELLGDYPYAKFATVESFWETGWGMPSFTLLGSRVMRLPFILHSSFPHEILHNWWGNGVYVDASQGNWSEGLTAYLADHRIKAKAGEGTEYRRSTLQKYAAFVGQGAAFPLREFRGRHDETTQAIGYGKALMLFHELRREVGGAAFFAGLKHFYQRYRFQSATFGDLLTALGADQAWQQRWLTGTSAARLALSAASTTPQTTGYRVQFTLTQQQGGEALPLVIPLRVQFADAKTVPHQATVTMTQTTQTFEVMLKEKPQQLAIDPDFDVFRVPDVAELPAALTSLYAKTPKTYVLSRKTDAAMQVAWETWLDTLKARDKELRVQYDDQPLPETGTLVFLGRGFYTLALSLRMGQRDIVLLNASTVTSLNNLLKKLPHYGKYSYVVFNSVTGDNMAKGQWDVTDSPLMTTFSNE
ncbi:M1 family metallopeptidase [Candidatus Thiothrix anitrata]|uniref:Peptidase M1 membrane alanine aminopeptidase domain-containing protein n=1 Tax=Candidatus Thiothrix anitrata TaxID=2823902 RepID=A0ABX7X310_9GAMM|nr:M1 family aminopeptidase [Candidatus Thiothrix anitrata]QTR50287.1 hypothetical protein J8380_01500 [Candidatus Thiothrix anitrata]